MFDAPHVVGGMRSYHDGDGAGCGHVASCIGPGMVQFGPAEGSVPVDLICCHTNAVAFTNCLGDRGVPCSRSKMASTAALTMSAPTTALPGAVCFARENSGSTPPAHRMLRCLLIIQWY